MSAQAATAEATPYATHGRGALLSLGTLAQFGASVMQQGTIVLGVFFALAYHLTLPQMGALLAAMTCGLMCSGLANGPLVDLWGPRRVLFCGTIVITAAAIAIAFSPNLIATVALLFLAGLSLGNARVVEVLLGVFAVFAAVMVVAVQQEIGRASCRERV